MRRGPSIRRECIACSAEFFAWPYQVAQGLATYCSDVCSRSARRRPVTRQFIEDNSIPEPNSGCWLWLGGIGSAGYGIVESLGRSLLAHRLSYSVFHEEPDVGVLVRHKCDNRACVNPEHLEAGSYTDNMQDASKRGRMEHGSSRWCALLCEEDIPDIRLRLESGETCRSIAELYVVDPVNHLHD